MTPRSWDIGQLMSPPAAETGAIVVISGFSEKLLRH
jgi:hypothetical protein